jgi:hypothetical protein
MLVLPGSYSTEKSKPSSFPTQCCCGIIEELKAKTIHAYQEAAALEVRLLLELNTGLGQIFSIA